MRIECFDRKVALLVRAFKEGLTGEIIFNLWSELHDEVSHAEETSIEPVEQE